MTGLSISPLARRIAEENNVDWQSLEGSDVGGGVNERDVLNYLEGVTLGTKPVNPTPEPLPEGMTAWAEEVTAPQVPQVAANMVSADNAGVTSLAAAEPAQNSVPVDETAYRELFVELGTLKKAAEAVAEKRRKEREVADGAHAETQLELNRVQKMLAGRETELAELRAQLTHLEAEIKTREERVHNAQLELTRLRETVDAQDEELVEVHALKQRVTTLQTQRSSAAAQAKEAQALAERLEKAEAATQKAQAEVETLKTANASLERTVTDLKTIRFQVAEPEKRPWWKLWG